MFTIDDLYDWVEKLGGAVRTVRSPEALRDYILDLQAMANAASADLESDLEAMKNQRDELRDEITDLDIQREQEREYYEERESKFLGKIELLEQKLAKLKEGH